MRIRLLFLPLLVVAVNPLVAETRVENGVRVHRMDSAASLAGQDSAEERSRGRVPIGLDRTFGASPSCATMAWRRTVANETSHDRAGHEPQGLWYERWSYRESRRSAAVAPNSHPVLRHNDRQH